MSNLMKIAAFLLALLGLLLGFLALHLMRSPAPQGVAQQVAVKPAAPPSPMRTVVLAAKDIHAGQTLTASMLKLGQWPRQPAGGFADTDAVLGRVARFNLGAGDPVLGNMLASGLATHLHEGERAVGIAVDGADSASARIAPGDMVDVFFTLNKNEEVGDTQTRLLLSRIRVLAYGMESVDGPVHEAAQAGARGGREGPQPVRSATLAVPLDDVNKVLLAMRRGKLQLVMRNPRDTAMPDVTLFSRPEPVLKGRKDLTPVQRVALGRGENQAFAGASLPQLAGSPQDDAKHDSHAAARGRSGGPGGHTIEMIRGDKSEKIAY